MHFAIVIAEGTGRVFVDDQIVVVDMDRSANAVVGVAPTQDEVDKKIVGIISTPATRIAQVVNAPAAQLARVFGAYSKKDETA